MSSPWHRGFNWTPQTDKRYAAWLCDRISRLQGRAVENFDTSLSPWFEEEVDDVTFPSIESEYVNG